MDTLQDFLRVKDRAALGPALLLHLNIIVCTSRDSAHGDGGGWI
jgi:hypothetical protein